MDGWMDGLDRVYHDVSMLAAMKDAPIKDMGHAARGSSGSPRLEVISDTKSTDARSETGWTDGWMDGWADR